MARKHYFDPRSKHIGRFLAEKGFLQGTTVHTRSTLEVRQEDGKCILINRAKKQQLVISQLFPAVALKEFVRSGILPYPKLIEPLD